VTKKVKAKKTKKKDDFALLDAALAAAPKSKAQKDMDKKKALQEERKKADLAAQAAKTARLAAEEAERVDAAKRGLVLGHGDELMSMKIVNRLPDADEDHATGLDAAVDLLSMKDKAEVHPERRRKAMYEAYLEAQLPIFKVEHPGLRLGQYKDRIFAQWQTSPENPMNQPKA
jgi:hypothetical protein